MTRPLFIILFIFTLSTTHAQISGGIKGGVNFSKLDSDFLTTDSETGFYGGIFATYEINDLFAIQPEIYYSHQAGSTAGFEYSFDYIAIPLLARFQFVPINVYAGAHLGFLMNVDATGVEKDDFKGVALSGTLGAGYEFPFGLELGGRYVHGLSDISNSELIKDVHFRMWEIYVAWRIIKN